MSLFDSTEMQKCVARLVAIRKRDNLDVTASHWAELLQAWHENVFPLDFHALYEAEKDADFLHDCYSLSMAYNKKANSAKYFPDLRTQKKS